MNIILVDDQEIVLDGLRDRLRLRADFVISGECRTYEEAIHAIDKYVPDIAIIDLYLPVEPKGLDVIRHIHEKKLDIKVLVFTVERSRDIFNYLLKEYGIVGYMLKSDTAKDLIPAIEAIYAGGFFLSRGLVRKTGVNWDALTRREWEVLNIIANGTWQSQSIAEKLNVVPATIERHRANIAEKLDLNKQWSLLQFVVENRNNITAIYRLIKEVV